MPLCKGPNSKLIYTITRNVNKTYYLLYCNKPYHPIKTLLYKKKTPVKHIAEQSNYKNAD